MQMMLKYAIGSLTPYCPCPDQLADFSITWEEEQSEPTDDKTPGLSAGISSSFLQLAVDTFLVSQLAKPAL